MVDWVVSRRVDESCYVGSLTRGGWALVIDCVLPFEASGHQFYDVFERG
jgi:hypothetical protein